MNRNCVLLAFDITLPLCFFLAVMVTTMFEVVVVVVVVMMMTQLSLLNKDTSSFCSCGLR
jgi:hypothetical protein